MSRISDVSSKLGEYMLKGYVLTDEACPKCYIPMLRTPVAMTPQRLFCSQCPEEESEERASSSTVKNPAESISSQSTSTQVSGVSTASTPPTDLSTASALSSPTFAPVSNPEEITRRRAQSDMASAEIGRRMLQGWAMLAEECPNPTCYGVPLVRPPRPGGEKDPRKECVVCHTVYVFQTNEYGQNALVSQVASQPTPIASAPTVRPAPRLPSPSVSSFVETGPSRPAPRQESQLSDAIPSVLKPVGQTYHVFETSTISTLSETISSLEQSLHALSSRLTFLSSQTPLDHVRIGEVASSIQQVTDALRTVKFLHFQERSQ